MGDKHNNVNDAMLIGWDIVLANTTFYCNALHFEDELLGRNESEAMKFKLNETLYRLDNLQNIFDEQ